MDNPPNTNIHTIVKAQIVFLLSTLTDENFERNQVEIRSLSEQHGIETYLHFIRRLILQSQSRLSPTASAPSYDASLNLTFRLLVQETQRLARDPFLADRFRDGIDKGEGDTFRTFDLLRFMDRIGLRPLERVILAASFVCAPLARKELSTQATAIIHHEFDNAVLSLCHTPSFDHSDLSPSQVSKLLTNLLSDPPKETPVLDPTQRQALIVAAQTKLGNETVVSILQRVLPNLSLAPSTTLVQALVQLGADITSDPEVMRAMLLRFGFSEAQPPDATQVHELMASLARLAAEGTPICDAGAFIRALVAIRTNVDWPGLVNIFDQPDRHGVDTATLKLLIAILINCPREVEQHAVTGLWAVWNNPLHQLRLLDALLSLPADTFNFVHLPGRRIVTVDDVSIASPTIKALAANVQGHTWNSLDLFEVLVRGTDSDAPEIRSHVREMLDKAIKISAELVHLGLLQASASSWNDLRLEYSRRLLSMFLAGHPNHQLVFMRIWQIEPSYLTNAFREFYEENHSNITRISDVAQDLKILEALLEVRPFTFALDIASLASRREYLNLDKWLADKVQTSGSEFLRAIIAFLEQKMTAEKQPRLLISEPPSDSRSLSLTPSIVAIFLRVLRNNASLINKEDVEYCIEVRNLCLQVHPRLLNLVPGSDAEPGLNVISYNTDIETEVDAIYKAMYDEQTRIEDVIALLKRNKESASQRDREIFSCMLHFLFDEYKFFQSYYPTRELLMTGFLYGSLIQYDLVDYLTLGIVLRYIVDALHCSPDSNLFRFGLRALERFESRLPEWRQLCQELMAIPHLFEIRPDLATTLPRILSIPETALNGSAQHHESSELVVAFTSIRADLQDEEISQPPEELCDRILFIVNNLAPSNFESKLEEMQETFDDSYSRWFANYLVDQRVSTEPNNHQLYLRFLDALDHHNIHPFVLQETFAKSTLLLNSERTMQSSTERAVLKNVAVWLGTITLARDRPIRHKNLSFKDLLLEGFDSGRLIVAIPFICKTLEPCAKSKVFKPPNPWLMAVLSLLAELYHYADLKLNLKFEIEVLCKALDVELDTIQATTILRNRPLTDSMAGPSLPDYVGDIDALPMSGFESSTQLIGDAQVLALGPSTDVDSQRVVGAHIETILSSLVAQIYINPSLAPLSSNTQFRRIVQLAVERAVREIIVPVVERSVTISSISTRELVLKDFATEPSEDKMRKAGHLMAQKLAGSLALVTCKEPLRVSLATHFRQYLAENGFYEDESQAAILDAVVGTLVQDNVDTACRAIEKGAMERAVKEIDDAFLPSYSARRRHRELPGISQFWDPQAPEPAFTASLPPALRVHPHGLQPMQAHVYEDFAGADFKGRAGSRPGSTLSYARSELATTGLYSPSPAPTHSAGAPYLSHPEAMDRFNAMMRELDAQLLQMPSTPSLAALPPNHDIRHLVRQALFTAAESADRQRTPLSMSQKIVQLLYKAVSQLGREVYVAILDQLCHSFEDVGKEVVNWLLYADDERKFNIAVTATLLRSGLISVSLEDQQLAQSLYTDPRPTLQTFMAGLIRDCLSNSPPIATQAQFAHSIEALRQLAQSGKCVEEVNILLEDLGVGRRNNQEESATAVSLTRPAQLENEQLREKLYVWFQQWVTIFQRSHSPEKSFVPFITQLNKQGVLKVDNVASSFFRVCAESSVISYLNCIQAGDFAFAFQALDATARLIIYIVKYHGGDASEVDLPGAKAYYLKKILTIFVLVLSSMHEEEGSTFPQKPFFRFFSSLINDLHTMEGQLGAAYPFLLIALSDTLNLVQPTYFPGFSFSWMSLISHRFFMPKLLAPENREGWSAFHQHCLSLFRFLAPFLKDSNLKHAAKDLYRGALRILLVLLHDFPEFLSEYYFSLCDVIPARCLQLRNIILSAFPPSVTLTDPYLPRPSDSIHETGPIPFILSDFSAGLKQGDLRVYLDQYLLGRGSPSFLPSLKDDVKYASPDGTGEAYNLSRMNAVVMYIGVSSVAQAKARNGSTLFVASDPGVVALQYLATNLDVEGQHHLLTAMVLHLRYPNAHTQWFISLLLHLFIEVKDDVFREVMTKVLLEKFVVHRPHPWGALVAFIELLRNPKYDFWSKEFVRIAPEVTLLLENVARSIFQP